MKATFLPFPPFAAAKKSKTGGFPIIRDGVELWKHLDNFIHIVEIFVDNLPFSKYFYSKAARAASRSPRPFLSSTIPDFFPQLSTMPVHSFSTEYGCSKIPFF